MVFGNMSQTVLKMPARAWLLFVLALTAGSSCAPQAELKPELKNLRPVPRFFMQEIVTRRKAAGLELEVYNTGAAVVAGDVLSELKSPQSRVRISAPVFVLKHPSQGLILFDAGLPPATGPRSKDDQLGVAFESSPGQSLLEQLRRDGVKPEDVRWIVLSDLSWPHVGELGAYPNATVIVGRREWERQKEKTAAGLGPERFDPAEMEPKLRLRLLDVAAAPPYGACDHGVDLFSDGTVILLDLAGHSPGGLGMWINLDSGPALLAGDASGILDNHQDLALPAPQTISDPAQYWRTLNMLNRLSKELPQLVVFPGHDLMPLQLQPRPDIHLMP